MRLSLYVPAGVHVRLTLYVAAEVHVQGSCKVDLNCLPTTGYLGGSLNSFTTTSTLLLNPCSRMSNSFNASASTLLIHRSCCGRGSREVELVCYGRGSCKVDLVCCSRGSRTGFK